ncbi:MAG: ABC transporter ATP-binding protein, partial [Deltaproteobacteria bacterium]
MLDLQDVTKWYGEKCALRGLNLRLEAGELFAFLGPNGAGKTTTIKMITGLLRPTSGRIMIGGHDVVTEPLRAKAMIAYVPDVPYIYEKLTGREFLRFVARMYRLPPERYEPAIAALIERFELGDFVDDLTEGFSHGMRQRTVFAASLLPDPRLLVIDEPMVGLDPRSIRIVKDLLKERSAAGTTIFMSTHTLAIAEE